MLKWFRRPTRKAQPAEHAKKTYDEAVRELWADAVDNAAVAGLKLSTMQMQDEPIRLHCLLTMSLIREVERLKAELNNVKCPRK